MMAKAAAALRKLQSNQSLTDAEKKLLGISLTPPKDPVQTEIDAINAATQPGRAVLAPEQYPMKEIVTNTGQKVMVYTGGPLAGQDTDGNFPIQATDPASFTPAGGGAGGGAGGSGGGTPTGRSTTVVGGAIPAAPAGLTAAQMQRKSAYDILYTEFKKYGLESLVEDVKGLIMTATSDAEITMGLRASENYKKRFSANEQRVAKGLRALDEATYLGMEDQYQEVMRQYGLPASYYTKDATGKQPGFEQLLANDISNVELADRLMVAQDRVLKANPEVLKTIRDFYPDITNGDILAYTLDPKNAIRDIQRKATAAEIGAAQTGAGLQATLSGAEALVANKVTGEQYQAAAPTISEASIRGGQLASIYREDPYTQQTAEQAVLNTPGSAEAIRRTKKLAGLETAAFSGQSGRGAIDRERAGQI
jgi:hypothetical protein